MGFLLTSEQESLWRTARAFVQDRMPIAHLRQLRDTHDRLGYSPEIWRELAAAGLVGVAIPEDVGGAGLGLADLGLVLEECGRTLAPTPFLSTVLLSANALLLAGSEAQRAEHLPAVCAGERVIAFAHEEGSRFRPFHIATRAQATSTGFRLSGEKSLVLDAYSAAALIVVARIEGGEDDRSGLALFLVPRGRPGLSVRPLTLIDNRSAASVVFDRVDVPHSALLGEPSRTSAVLDEVLNRATAGLCAEMLGATQEVFERTVSYLKERKQFGVPIGSFQALKHRAAWMFAEIELAKSVVAAALRAIDEKTASAGELVSVAKTRLSETFVQVAGEAIQMHGGIGVTDELDIGFFYKRARVAEMTLGDAAWHRDRFARLGGY